MTRAHWRLVATIALGWIALITLVLLYAHR